MTILYENTETETYHIARRLPAEKRIRRMSPVRPASGWSFKVYKDQWGGHWKQGSGGDWEYFDPFALLND